MRAVIIANGVISGKHPVLRPDDHIIAVDGGYRHCLAFTLCPHLLIGDMDSLTPEEIDTASRSGIPVARYPTRKDFTDLELALQTAVQTGADDIVLIGALGARWDMTLANIMILASPVIDGCRTRIWDGDQEISLLQGGKMHRFDGTIGDILSLIPLGKDVHHICTTGLEYPLSDETLHFSATRGISNVFCEKTATVVLGDGLLICVIQHLSNTSMNV